jgi:uroporphyrin-III C-methyltransferase
MTVYLVGAGPGSPDLLTVRAANLLKVADVVVHDRLVDPAVLALVSPHAELIDVGKHPGHLNTQGLINSLLISLGQSHECVVRLKGGDPFVFGRGGEEFEALYDVGIRCEVVPGITSAFAAPLVAGIPVTHRGLSHGVTVVTGHAQEGSSIDFRRLANPDVTLVVLMGVQHRRLIMEELLEGGLTSNTPVAVVEKASLQGQTVTRARLSELADLDVAAPAVMVIGPAASLNYSVVTSFAQASVH